MSWRYPSRRSFCGAASSGQVLEPIEEVVISVPDEYAGHGHQQAEYAKRYS